MGSSNPAEGAALPVEGSKRGFQSWENISITCCVWELSASQWASQRNSSRRERLTVELEGLHQPNTDQDILLFLCVLRHSHVKSSSSCTSSQEEWNKQDNICRGRWGHTNTKNESNYHHFVNLQCYDSLKNNLRAIIKDLLLVFQIETCWEEECREGSATEQEVLSLPIQDKWSVWAMGGRIKWVSLRWSGQKARREADKPVLAGGILLLCQGTRFFCFCEMDYQQKRNQCNCQQNYFLRESG